MQPLADLAPALLATLGVAATDVRDELTGTVTDVLGEFGYDAHVVGLRHGVLTLSCDAFQGNLLRYDLDRVRAEVNDRTGDGQLVRTIRVHTDRG